MKKPILVTGAHRSGSTWTGKVIAAAKNVRYVHEPLNIGINHKNSPITHWFEYMNDSDKDKQQQYLKYINSFSSPFHKEQLKRLRNVKSIGAAYGYLNNLQGRLLIKDPIAIMSAEWFFNELGSDVIITIRHPAAFIASIKLKDWQFDFENFLDQENLMDAYLSKYRSNIEAYVKQKPDIVSQGILLWNILYDTVLSYKEKYGEKWYFITHEALSINPLSEFEKIFNFLDLNFDDTVKQLIIASTTAQKSGKLQRDSKDNVKSWKKRLSEEEIDLIKRETKDVWSHFYTESDWE